MAKRILLLFFCLLLLPLSAFGSETEATENPVRMRALLIGCDHFVTQASTYPAAGSNVDLIAQALLRDRREYRRIVTRRDGMAGADELKTAVQTAYAGADENDINLFYISTHGVYPKGKPMSEAALLLSDGQREYALTAAELKAMLDAVPGKKMLILDACHAGAFIGKGLSHLAVENVFATGDYAVLTSAGGNEESWYWKGRDDGDPNVQYGASYFASVLSKALTPGSTADGNRDGVVTVSEMHGYLYANYAASTPHCYPEYSDFALFAYDETARSDHRLVSGLTFDQDVLVPGQNVMSFTYTLHEPVNVYYQLIYHHKGAWDFDNAQLVSDNFLTGEQAAPGRKMRALSLETDELDTAGYVMLLLLTKEDDRLEMQASHLLCVQPAKGEIRLSAYAGSAFCPAKGEEISIVVRHDLPCSLSVSIENRQGDIVRRLTYSQPTRPQSFPGSTYAWDGKMQDGAWAPAGEYRVRVETRTGGQKQTVWSEAFSLLDGET